MDAKPFDETSGVEVSRDLLAAARTDMLARRDVLGDPVKAPVAELGRAPRVDEDRVLPEQLRLEDSPSRETAPRSVGDGFCEVAILKHPGDVQPLQDEGVVLGEYPVNQLVLEVLSLAPDVQVEPGEPAA